MREHVLGKRREEKAKGFNFSSLSSFFLFSSWLYWSLRIYDSFLSILIWFLLNMVALLFWFSGSKLRWANTYHDGFSSFSFSVFFPLLHYVDCGSLIFTNDQFDGIIIETLLDIIFIFESKQTDNHNSLIKDENRKEKNTK